MVYNYYKNKTKGYKTMELKEMIKVMQHFEDSGEIEVKGKNEEDTEWGLTDYPIWDWCIFEYRIKKPKQKVTIEKWLCRSSFGNFVILECSNVDMLESFVKVKFIESYEIEFQIKIKGYKMNFIEALKYLGIDEYGERIFNSNSRGELSHLQDYIELAEYCKDNNEYCDIKDIKEMFISALNIWNDDVFMQHFPCMVKPGIKTKVFLSLSFKELFKSNIQIRAFN